MVSFRHFFNSVVFIVLITCPSEYLQTSNSPFIKLQNATNYFDNKIFAVVLNETSNKAKIFLNKNSLSFVLSPLWLELYLALVSIGTTRGTLKEINDAIFLKQSTEEKINIFDYYLKNQPNDDYLILEVKNMMFYRSDITLNKDYQKIAEKYKVMIDFFEITNKTMISKTLNEKVKRTTKKKMKDIFDDSDFVDSEATIVLVNSVYYKNRWLYSPTVLNGTSVFRNDEGKSQLDVKMFRINGLMPYAHISEWDAKIVDIPYITQNTSMLLFLPNKVDGLKAMETYILNKKNIIDYTNKLLQPKPVAVVLPKYTLESTLILPNKLQNIGIYKLFTKGADLDKMINQRNIPVSHAIQRLKLWADAGRGAYKDTGDEELPKFEEILIADRPFFFIIKMNGTTFMMGHFTA